MTYSNRNCFNYEQLNKILREIFQLAKQIHSLEFSIDSNYFDYLKKKKIDLSRIIPSNIKHLKISISQMDEMNLIIDQLKCLSSIHFRHRDIFRDSSDLFVQWLELNRQFRPYQTYRINPSSLFLWINSHQ